MDIVSWIILLQSFYYKDKILKISEKALMNILQAKRVSLSTDSIIKNL
jgi:hypothetical protein